MGATLVLVPVMITAWPTLLASATAVAAAAGFRVSSEKQPKPRLSVEIDMQNLGAVGEALSNDDKITVVRDGVRVVFSRNARGQFKACVEGDKSSEELSAIGEELAGRVIQQYVYRRLTQELENQGFVTLDEEKGVDDAIRIHVRRHEV